MTQARTEVELLLERAAAGDGAAWGTVLSEHQPRLQRLVRFRLDRRLRGRIDEADVLQEAYLEASAHREDYFRLQDGQTFPVFLWLRGIVSNKLLELHRHHLGTRKRDAGRDQALDRHAGASDTCEALVAELADTSTGPATAAQKREISAHLRRALQQMEDIDREVLALRHYERLSNSEAAQVLGIKERAAAKRYLRALKRLKELLAEMPGGLTGLRP